MSSDGRYLAVTSLGRPGGAVFIYRIEGLSPQTEPVDLNRRRRFNLPEGALVTAGRLFIADTPFSRVHIWGQVESALRGHDPDVILGASDPEDRIPAIGVDKLFWPGAVSFDGRYLWVGEFKFSGHLLRFSPQPN